MRPVIGITCGRKLVGNGESYSLTAEIAEAVWAYGGLPVILPGTGGRQSLGPYLHCIQGLLLPGGGDLEPEYFQQEPQPGLKVVDPERDILEVGLIREAWIRKLPILAICRGMQVLNAALGGQLWQDLQTELQHEQNSPRWHVSHQVVIEQGSMLERIMGVDKIKVNSFHHQGVSIVAPELHTVATSSDGLVEAVEGPGFVLGVQWHPEWLWQKEPIYGKIFQKFVERAVQSCGF